MENNKLPYEKPHFDWWTSSELDAIEATMSGGGGGSGSTGFTYAWDTTPIITETDSDIASLAVSIATGIIVAVITKNGSLTKAIAGSVASAVASYLISKGISVVYYRSYCYLLRGQPKNPNTGVGFVAGEVVVTKCYDDQARRNLVSGPSMYSNISSNLAYMETSCPGYQLL